MNHTLAIIMCTGLLAISGPVHASDCYEWSTTDKLIAGTAVGLLMVDIGQTQYIMDHPDLHITTHS